MYVKITKVQDGNAFITKDPFGVLFDGDLVIDAEPTVVSTDCSVVAVTRDRFGEEYHSVVFAWVDYKDTSIAVPAAEGVHQIHELEVPGSVVAGPYTVYAEA